MPIREIYTTAVFTVQFARDIQKAIFFTIQKMAN
jgi:hypothetical protein